MSQATNGSKVQVHYTGRLDNGEIFDSSEGREPLAFTVGEGQVIEGFDAAVMGMSVGETKTVKIPCDEAYGPHSEDMVLNIARSEVPEGINPEVGDQLSLRDQAGRIVPVVVSAVSDTQITLDANHPLAGEDLTFDITLVSIESPIILP